MIFFYIFLFSFSYEDNTRCNNYFCYSYDREAKEWELTGILESFSTYGYSHSNPLDLEPNFEDDDSPLTSINCIFYTPSNKIQLNISNTIKFVSSRAFYKVNDITMNITFADGVTIKTGAFKQCKSLISIQFLGSIKILGEHSFQECSNLQHISALDVEEIGDNAFYNCIKLASELEFSNRLKTIGKYSFAFCKKLRGNLVIQTQ